jgi:hypothetical protein
MQHPITSRATAPLYSHLFPLLKSFANSTVYTSPGNIYETSVEPVAPTIASITPRSDNVIPITKEQVRKTP